MDAIAADLAVQAILDRGDFIGGIDNEALDFSQLDDYITTGGSTGGGYFDSLQGAAGGTAPHPSAAPTPATAYYTTESLQATPTQTPANQTPTTGTLLNVIVENKRQPGHALPDSPPDSGSEHPYSPSESCEPPLDSQEMIYTTLGQPTHLLNPLLAENLLLGSSIVVPANGAPRHGIIGAVGDRILGEGLVTSEGRLLVNEADPRLMQGRILLQSTDSNGATLTHLDGRQILTQDGITDGRHMIIAQESSDSNSARQILIQPGPSSQGSPSYSSDRSLLVENTERRQEIEPNLTNYNGNLTSIDNQMIDTNIDVIYTNLQSAPKKRKLSQDVPLVKSEPELCNPGQLSPPGQISGNIDEDYAASENGACLSDSQYQCIRFQPFQQSSWHVLCDQNLTELPIPHYRVDADKGFNFSNADDAFVCQKKNHFQITCHVLLIGDAQFVKTAEGLQKINSFHLHFYGVKYDCPTQTIRVEQSQSDRSKKPFHPVLVELVNSQQTKVTVGRLHFSETTSNNMRKKGKPNPEQRYFQLVVGLHAHTSHGNYPVASHASQRIIVRASNPGQFESDVELCWQKGQTQESIFHAGKVGINTDRPDESLVIHGNLKITGHIIQPSDLRAKKNIVECNTAEQLRNVQRLRVVRYEYAPGFASQLNLSSEVSDTGVIAQEVAQIIPEAVSPTGDIVLDNGRTINNFLVVNKERIFMENVGAVKELCKVTDNLETRIGQLERINRRLNKLKRDDSLKSNSTVTSSKHSNSLKCHKHHSCQKDPELCSNKFIQIVIVILVLIMAFCLAAITILYLMETSRHSQPTPHNNYGGTLQTGNFHTKRPGKNTKQKPTLTPQIQNIHHNSYKEKGNEITNHRPSVDNPIHISKTHNVIGKPSYCPSFDGDECPIFCCTPLDSSEVETSLYDKTQKPNLNLTKHSKIPPQQVNSNNIDKSSRNKRDSDVYWQEPENIYDSNLDCSGAECFTVIIQGKHFNMTLNNDYLDSSSSFYNLTYFVPLSKYMADETITLIFRLNHQSNMRDLEQCYSEYKQQECPYSSIWDDNKPNLHKGIENLGQQQIGPKIGNVFEIDVVGVQTFRHTFRASPVQTQNVCNKLSEGKIGIDYIEYNLNFYRDCDE